MENIIQKKLSGPKTNVAVKPEIPARYASDPTFKKYGSPFIIDENYKVKLNERAIAAKCAADQLANYNAPLKQFDYFDRNRGLWLKLEDSVLIRKIDNLLIELGDAYGYQMLVRGISAGKLSSLSKMMKAHGVRHESANTTGLMHTRSGIVDLNTAKPKLMAHDPKYPFRLSSEIVFDPKATCPKFLKTFLGSSLEKSDIALLQKYCGSMLIGPNTCHGILVIRGTPGGGKSTLISIMEKIIGETNVAHLRTSHLGGRFETSAFLGRRLLVGKDVPGDTLKNSGAQMLKSLTGGDQMQAEIKYNPDKQPVRGDFHVVIVSNNNLRIALDGDTEAWRRRLLIVDFNNPKPAKAIPHFAEQLVFSEGSGILNWLIEGALAFRAEMESEGNLKFSDAQIARVSTLLADSDNITSFVRNHLVERDEEDVTSEELWLWYHDACRTNKWSPVSMHKFQTRIPELVAEQFSITRRHDILREGRAVRGYKNIALID